MVKAAVLYEHPIDVEAFENYYTETHLPIVSKVQGIIKSEYTKFLPAPDGTAAGYYRMAELYFEGPAEMQQTLASPEGKAMAADLGNFATGGVTILMGIVEN